MLILTEEKMVGKEEILMLFYSGGETDVSNCQILQSRVNRFKSNRSDVGDHDLRQFSCELKFSGMCLFCYSMTLPLFLSSV